MIQESDLEQVAKVPLFRDLTTDAVRTLLSDARVIKLDRGRLLFSKGDPADSFFALISGEVKLFSLSESGDQGIVELVQPVNTFAEAAMFASGRFPVNAEAIRASRVVRIGAAGFRGALAADSVLAFTILGLMARRHRSLLAQLSELRLKSPAQRLATYILSLSEQTDGAVTITLPLEKVLIAGQVGIAPESLSRALARLRDMGVTTDGSEVRIDNVRGLRTFCGEGEAV